MTETNTKIKETGGVIDVSSWDEFEKLLGELYALRETLQKRSGITVSRLLFRGQADKQWKLTTTLERYKKQNYSLYAYYMTIFAARPQIETFTGQEWKDLPDPLAYEKLTNDYDMLFSRKFPAYAYMIYLRHHGFPSPLLDWTRSPYIAAFFAFASSKDDVENVSIYAFLEDTGLGKLSSDSEPYILHLGPYVSSHKRHFIQQCEYTICTLWKDETWRYDCHENVLELHSKQDVLWKFNIPASERLMVLEKLNKYNLNAYSLFQSEESLMDTIALKHFYLR